ncbi:MAG: hypothetical protein JNM17_04080 [Archangium sp.]|nr:hypothetical protein [Archangium sp.]
MKRKKEKTIRLSKRLTAPGGLLRFDSVQVAIDVGAEPKWNKLFPVGVTRFRSDFPGGKITLSKAYLQSFVTNWERLGKPSLPVDYWHDDESPSSVASGWIEGLELRDDGLYGRIKWTVKAKAKIDADELRFLSPSFSPDAEDPTTGKRMGPTLFGAALLNKPFLFDLPRVAAGRDPIPTPKPQENTNMLRTLLLSIFALPEVTTDETLAERIRQLKAENLNFSKDLESKLELTSKPLKVELAAAKDRVTALEADLVKRDGEITKLKKDAQDAEINAYLDTLVSEKKLVPANRENAKEICLKMGMDFAKKHLGAAAPVVPEGEKGFRGQGSGEQLSAEQVTKQVDDEIERIKKDNPGLSTAEARKRLGAEKPELLKMASKASAKKPSAEA